MPPDLIALFQQQNPQLFEQRVASANEAGGFLSVPARVALAVHAPRTAFATVQPGAFVAWPWQRCPCLPAHCSTSCCSTLLNDCRCPAAQHRLPDSVEWGDQARSTAHHSSSGGPHTGSRVSACQRQQPRGEREAGGEGCCRVVRFECEFAISQLRQCACAPVWCGAVRCGVVCRYDGRVSVCGCTGLVPCMVHMVCQCVKRVGDLEARRRVYGRGGVHRKMLAACCPEVELFHGWTMCPFLTGHGRARGSCLPPGYSS